MTDTTIHFSNISFGTPRLAALLGRSLHRAIIARSIRHTLNALPDVVLNDMGLTRGEIPMVAERLASAGEGPRPLCHFGIDLWRDDRK